MLMGTIMLYSALISIYPGFHYENLRCRVGRSVDKTANFQKTSKFLLSDRLQFLPAPAQFDPQSDVDSASPACSLSVCRSHCSLISLLSQAQRSAFDRG